MHACMIFKYAVGRLITEPASMAKFEGDIDEGNRWRHNLSKTDMTQYDA
ncbi:hypothetical protein KT99_09463 [Shewanella benthica KT99]|uniref:Uncharacterized protein n=1 Tax=Shewanella benthica KT99 TaxID=314608 RepID=A9DJM7_9GAMM|nr:hypothetical protein KT99_09463 [Shewanella benthica KT99]